MHLQRDPLVPDVWVWSRASGSYTTRSYYAIMHSHLPTILPCQWLWQSKCTMKIKVFVWLLFFDRLNTEDLLVRRHWRSTHEDNFCVICSANVMRTEDTCSLNASSTPEFGTTYRLIGLMALMPFNVFHKQGCGLDIHSCFKLC